MLVDAVGMFIEGYALDFEVSFSYGLAAVISGAALRVEALSFLTFCLGPLAKGEAVKRYGIGYSAGASSYPFSLYTLILYSPFVKVTTFDY